jgi:biotin carboxyl carrier protein
MPDSQKTYRVKANEFSFSLDNADIAAIDLVQKSPTSFNLIKDHRSVNVLLIDSDASGKKMTLEVDGEIFDVDIKDDLDQMLDKMGFGAASAKQIKEIKAPMPGLVLEINVSDGEEVTEGHKILILEAMKMENVILVHTNAKIKKIIVSAGQAVEKGQVLVELE